MHSKAFKNKCILGSESMADQEYMLVWQYYVMDWLVKAPRHLRQKPLDSSVSYMQSDNGIMTWHVADITADVSQWFATRLACATRVQFTPRDNLWVNLMVQTAATEVLPYRLTHTVKCVALKDIFLTAVIKQLLTLWQIRSEFNYRCINVTLKSVY